MRIQFCKSNLLNAYELINEGHANIPRPLQLVKSSTQFMNDPVLLLGDILHTRTMKYSKKMTILHLLWLILQEAFATYSAIQVSVLQPT